MKGQRLFNWKEVPQMAKVVFINMVLGIQGQDDIRYRTAVGVKWIDGDLIELVDQQQRKAADRMFKEFGLSIKGETWFVEECFVNSEDNELTATIEPPKARKAPKGGMEDNEPKKPLLRPNFNARPPR